MKKINLLVLSVLGISLLASCGGNQNSTSRENPSDSEIESVIESPVTSEIITPSEAASIEEISEEESVNPSEEPSVSVFDPTPYMTVLSEAKTRAKTTLEGYIANLDSYSDNGKTSISSIIADGKQMIDNCVVTNDIVDILYVFEGKLDNVPNAKQERGNAFVDSLYGYDTDSGYNSLDLVSVDKDGKVIFNSLTAWGQIEFGSHSDNQYKAFECDILVDYETTKWGSFDFYVNRASGTESLILAITNDSTRLVNMTGGVKTDIMNGNPLIDNKAAHLEVICSGNRKLMLIDGVPNVEVEESSHNEGTFTFSLWQTLLQLDNITYKEYDSSEALNADYRESLAKSISAAKKEASEKFLADWLRDGCTGTLEVMNNGDIVSNETGWTRQKFSESSGNDFEVFDIELTPTFTKNDGYVTVEFRKQDDNHKFVLVLMEGKIALKKHFWNTKAGEFEYLGEERDCDLIGSGKKIHIKIMCSGWVKNVTINDKLYIYHSENFCNSGAWGIDSNSATYIIQNAKIKRYASQNDLAAENALWSSSYNGNHLFND